MIIVRCLRPDRIVFATTAFIINNLGQKFTEPPVLDLNSVLSDSMPTSPLIFVLSPGVDPTNQLLQLAEQKGTPTPTAATTPTTLPQLPHCPNCPIVPLTQLPIASMPHCPNCPNCPIAPMSHCSNCRIAPTPTPTQA